MADHTADGVWDVSGCGRSCDELPIGAALIARIRAWQAWFDAEEEAMVFDPPPFEWMDAPGAPVDAFHAEGRDIVRALKAELPPDWTAIYGGDAMAATGG